MIELYHTNMSVCSQKVRFALAEKKLRWEDHHVNLQAGEQLRPEYLKLNPNAVVPTLVDNGAVIIESTVINEYLDDAYLEPSLRPGNSIARSRMRLWTKRLDEGIHAATRVVSFAIAFRHQRLALGMEKLEKFHQKIPDPEKRERSWEDITKGVESRYFPDAIMRFDKLLADMEIELSNGPWLAGLQFSLADIGYAPYILRLDHLQLQFLWDERRQVAAWYDRVQAQHGYKEDLDDRIDASYLPLMKEKGAEVRSRVKMIVASA